MILLPPPRGYRDFGTHISLRSNSRNFDDKIISGILWSYSCYKPSIPRVLSCLHHSGRYDCVIAGSWFRSQWPFVTAELAEHGIELIVLEESEHHPLFKMEDCKDSYRQKEFRKQMREAKASLILVLVLLFYKFNKRFN